MTTDTDKLFRIAVLGNFRGDASRRSGPLHVARIDRDNFDSVMRKLEVRLDGIRIGPNASPMSIRFSTLEDFHPDCLVSNLDVFATLRSIRTRLQNPETFAEATKEFLALGGQFNDRMNETVPAQSQSRGHEDTPRHEVTINEGSLLDQILEPNDHMSTSDSSLRQESPNEWQRVIESIVAPYLVAGADPRQAELINGVDASLQATLSAVLHHPSFQALEASWRGLHLLVHRLETNAQLCVHLIDISKAELTKDLVGSSELTQTTIYQAIVEETLEVAGGEPWSLLVGDYSFGSGDEDAQLLRQLARIATVAEAPLIAGADFKQFRSVSGEPWQLLRRSVEAGYVGLVWPRFLLRLPYGKETNPIDAFNYEEVGAESESPPLLWGNSSYLSALLFGQSFTENGCATFPSTECAVERLPVWVFNRDGAVELHPCGERLLTDSAAEQLMQLGITPLISIRDRDSVRIRGTSGLNGKRLLGKWRG